MKMFNMLFLSQSDNQTIVCPTKLLTITFSQFKDYFLKERGLYFKDNDQLEYFWIIFQHYLLGKLSNEAKKDPTILGRFQ